jgi:hypothetical protein
VDSVDQTEAVGQIANCCSESSNPGASTKMINGSSPKLGEEPFLAYGLRFASEQKNAPSRFKPGVEKEGIKT